MHAYSLLQSVYSKPKNVCQQFKFINFRHPATGDCGVEVFLYISIYVVLLAFAPLQPLRMLSYAFGGILIMHFDGSFQAEVSVNVKSCTANLMVSTADMPPIISCDLINAV